MLHINFRPVKTEMEIHKIKYTKKSIAYIHRNLKSISIIKARKVKEMWGENALGLSSPKLQYIYICIVDYVP
jgi:hypothetical protein